MSDETFDYGLDSDESFDLWEETVLGPYDPHIMTVLGPIEPGELPPTNAHATIAMLRDPASHVWIESQEHQAQALAELEEALAVGIGAFVDLNGPMHGRNPALLRAIAENSSVTYFPSFFQPSLHIDTKLVIKSQHGILKPNQK